MLGSRPRIEIRDPIHDFIPLNDVEMKIVNSEPFQRLRRIRQLAFTYLVYPGALHTRYEHSIGTCHVADRIAERLALSQKERSRIRLAALLHDIGHPPFSHVGEAIMEQSSSGKTDGGREKKKAHELLSYEIIRSTDDIAKVLDGPDGPGVEEVISLLEDTGDGADSVRSLGSSIISGQIDADKMDYLMRDCHYTGVKYGVFDINRIVNTVCSGGDSGRFAFEEAAVPALEQMILARFFMHQQVYMHKTRIIADAMAIRAVLLDTAPQTGSSPSFSFDRMKKNLNEFLALDDESLMRRTMNSKSVDSVDLITGLRNRRLLHSVVKLQIQ